MAGIVFMGLLGGYLFVSVMFVYAVIQVAKKAGHNPWFPGISVALFMYLLIFWDFIPVLVKHHNLCKEQGGYWIYKTPEEWFKENPDAIGKKWKAPKEYTYQEEAGGWSRTWLSNYIYSETHFNRNYAHAISKYEHRLVDARTGEILVRMVDFERGAGNPFLHADSMTDYKLWLRMGDNRCDSHKRREFNLKVNEIINKFRSIGDKK